MSLLEALDADRAGDLYRAADLYEEHLAANFDCTTAVNLGVLYWQVTDYGFWSGMRLDSSFVERAGVRYIQVLAAARDHDPSDFQAPFWLRYVDFADLGEALTSHECKSWLRLAPHFLDPAMQVFTHTGGRECGRQAIELLARCRQDRTTRNRYIASIIEAAIAHNGRPGS